MNDGTGNVFETSTVQRGNTVGQPADPSRIGYTLAGWYLNADNRNNPFDFNTVIMSNLSVFAAWIPDTPANTVIPTVIIVVGVIEDGLVHVSLNFPVVGSGQVINVNDNGTATITIVPDMGYIFNDSTNIIMDVPSGIDILEGPTINNGNITFVIDASVLIRRLQGLGDLVS